MGRERLIMLTRVHLCDGFVRVILEVVDLKVSQKPERTEAKGQTVIKKSIKLNKQECESIQGRKTA